MEKGLTIKAIIQDQKDIKALASAGADMNTSQDRHLTASQLSTASLAESGLNLTLREAGAHAAEGKLDRGKASKMALEAGLTKTQTLDGASRLLMV